MRRVITPHYRFFTSGAVNGGGNVVGTHVLPFCVLAVLNESHITFFYAVMTESAVSEHGLES